MRNEGLDGFKLNIIVCAFTNPSVEVAKVIFSLLLVGTTTLEH